MANVPVLVVAVLVWGSARAEENKKRTIKGQQYVRQTAVGRLVGGPVPPELLSILQGNATIQHSSPSENGDGKKAPHLITDEVKTIVTRMVIPLNTTYADSERYLTMIRKFLTKNLVNLTHVDRLESASDALPSTSAIALKLQAAANLKSNLIAILGNILALPVDFLPKQTHAPLAHIHRLLQLRRIPIIDLLEHYPKLARPLAQDQWLTIFIELEKQMPAYMKSCATFLIESMQDKVLNMDELIQKVKDPSMPKLLTGVPYQGGPHNPANKPLLFPKRILTGLNPSHEDALGRTMACMLATVAETGRNYSPRLLALFLLHLPRNTPNAQFDDNAFTMAYTQDAASPAEFDAVADAFYSSLSANATPSEIFYTILGKIVTQKFEGYEKYFKLMLDFEVASEAYVA